MVNMLFSLYNFHEHWAKDVVAKYINYKDKVLIIPFSFGDKMKNHMDWHNAYDKECGTYYKSVVMPFLSYGVKEENISWINYFKDTKESAKDKIKNSNVIFFTGGLPDKMMCRLEEFDLINGVKNFTGVVIGSSAGAMIQLEEYHITPDKDYDVFSYNRGLSLIKDFGIEVHYEETELQNTCISKVLNERVDTVYAIKDNGGMIVDNDSRILLGDVRTFSGK